MWKTQERKAVKAEFLNLFVFGQMDSKIHLTIILQEVRKELKHVSLLRISRAETKYYSQHLHMKEQ